LGVYFGPIFWGAAFSVFGALFCGDIFRAYICRGCLLSIWGYYLGYWASIEMFGVYFGPIFLGGAFSVFGGIIGGSGLLQCFFNVGGIFCAFFLGGGAFSVFGGILRVLGFYNVEFCAYIFLGCLLSFGGLLGKLGFYNIVFILLGYFGLYC
jgi:hypothetical protein